MSVETYYRVLSTKAHYDEWHSGHHNSCHTFLPGEWTKVYYDDGCRDERKYPLLTFQGKHTILAVRNFIKIAGKYKKGAIWQVQELIQACQLDGVCAFSNPKCAVKYANGSLYSGISVVEFEGEFVSPIPETSADSSGVLVKPTKQLFIHRFEDFKRIHG